VANGFKASKLWQGMKKYGFDAIGAVMSAASIGMCIHQAIGTFNGAREMNKKLDETAVKIKRTRDDLNHARANVNSITLLQGTLFANLTRDAKSILGFFVNDTTTPDDNATVKRLKEEVAKETPKFRELLKKVMTVGSSQQSQTKLRQHLDSLSKLLAEMRFSLVRIYQKVKMSIQVRNSVRARIPVSAILRNLIASGFKVDGTFGVVKEIAWSNKEMTDYDNYPLNCIRKGIIKNQLELDMFMKASGTEVISEQVKKIIKMAVDFYKSPVLGDRSIVQLLKVQNKLCGIEACTYDDVLRVVAEEYPDWTEYDGYQLEKYRNKQKIC